MKKRIFSLILTMALLLTCTANAETVKHERLYAVTGADGTAQTIIDSIHLENADKLDEIADVTALTDIENVSGHEAFTLSGEKLTWQANGSDIVYQGGSTAALPVSPIVTYSLDGNTVSAGDLIGKKGNLSVNVAYTCPTDAPILAVSVLLLDEEHCTDVVCDNAVLVSDGNRSMLIGFGVPGMPEGLDLPNGFSFTCACDNVSFDWMYTIATASPLKALLDQTDGKVADSRTLVDLLTSCLTALRDGTDMPDGDKDIVSVFSSLAELKNGTSTLADGATQLSAGVTQLSDGAAQLSTGATQLETGLTTLVSNNDTLNNGATQLFTAVLNTANAQLAASGLADKGITLPELTADNYATVLDGVLAQLNPDTLRKSAEDSARETVRTQVMKQESKIRDGVQQVVEAKVLEGVLTSAQLPMSAEDYVTAVKAGNVTKEQEEQISAAVAQQLATDEVKAQIESAFEAQVAQLVEQNLQSDEIQAKISAAIAPAQTAFDTLNGLKGQLDSVNAFVTGLKSYTDGVTSACDGAAQLTTGTATLVTGVSDLATGSSAVATGAATLNTSIADGMKKITDKMLPLLTGDAANALNDIDQVKAALNSALSYDLVSPSMSNDLLVIIRTEMAK